MAVFDELSKQLKLPVRRGDDPGFREAQIAAIHAVGAHFWDRSRPALVVMPTGAGKTAVMMAAAIVLRALRVLIVAPNKLLREQLVEKFEALDPLRDLGALSTAAKAPRVHEVEHKLATKKMWTSLKQFDVVVGTPMTMSPELPGIAEPPDDLFDVILFDEAHHVPAPSFAAIATAFPRARQVLFTATPFRRDEREVPGDLIFTYELARARRDGVYGELNFNPVHATPGDDQAIAEAATAQLRADKKNGFAHRLVVRAEGKKRADALAKIYQKTNLKLLKVHSGLGAKRVRKAIEDLKAGTIDGVIAVDMLGEGFDLPNLKVAALHTPHKSLAVTLQFIGRFARTSGPGLGPATFFAIPQEVAGDAERLFVPGAEWNEIVEDLSRNKIEVEKETRRVIAGFKPVAGDALSLDKQEIVRSQLWSLRPFVHAKVYDVRASVDLDVQPLLPRGMRPLVTHHNADEHALICIAEQRSRNRWSDSDALADTTHDLFIVQWVREQQLVFVCTTRRENSVYDDIIESIVDGPYRRLAPDEVNRVMNGLENLKLFGAGMRNRAGGGGGGGESYRTVTGPSADQGIQAMDAARCDQGHAMCSGIENGKSVVIGFSSGSKIWGNTNVPIAYLFRRFREIGKKLRDAKSQASNTMFGKLGVASRISSLPGEVVSIDLPVVAYARPHTFVKTGKHRIPIVDLDVEVSAGSQTATGLEIIFSSERVRIPIKYDLKKQPLFTAGNALARDAVLVDSNERGDEDFVAFLNEQPPIFYLSDLSSVVGDTVSAAPTGNDDAIAGQIETVDWLALGVDPHTEKPPAKRGKRSLFEYVESRLQKENAKVIFLDDSSNEIADYVAVHEKADRVLVQLFHCKSAKGPTPPAKTAPVPNERVGDLFEVLGQAIKCRRWLETKRLLAQAAHRVSTTKQSKFIVGDLETMKELLEDAARVVFEVVVVQPAISSEPKDTVAALLASADAYHQGSRVRFIGTAPK